MQKYKLEESPGGGMLSYFVLAFIAGKLFKVFKPMMMLM
jgi:hypothetical protein